LLRVLLLRPEPAPLVHRDGIYPSASGRLLLIVRIMPR
jgi:hypothetical protein